MSFGTYTSPQRNQGMLVQSIYIPMRDGVRLAADVYLPGDLTPDTRIPAIVNATRYWRDQDLRFGFKWMDSGVANAMSFFVERGYAMLNIDVRGTGASFGTRRHEWDKEEIQDGYDIAEWIVNQAWSNGKIGGYGTSYSGTTAELLTVPNHPAVKAVLPRFNEFDVYTDIAFPGGLYLQGFVEEWGTGCAALDSNRVPPSKSFIVNLIMGLGVRGVKAVDADADRQLLKQAIAEHATNIHANVLSRGITSRDDTVEGLGYSVDDFSVHSYREQIEASGVPIYGWGGWFDAYTADAVIRRFMTLSNPQVAVIGAWNHGASQHASPFDPRPLNMGDHWQEALRFFDHYLYDEPTSIAEDVQEKTLYYFTIGAEEWRKTTTWPPAGVEMERWFMDKDKLQAFPSDSGDQSDMYEVDYSATSGGTNRWYTQAGGGEVMYADRREQDTKLLTYTSDPLRRDTEITGNAVVTLHIETTADDGAFIVYLEAVTPEGDVLYLTEGQLRGIHRKRSEDTPPYAQTMPYHSFKAADVAPITPGEITEITFGLLPISAVIPKGFRLRVAIAGADEGLFPRIPASGETTIRVHRGRVHPSIIDLPVVNPEHG